MAAWRLEEGAKASIARLRASVDAHRPNRNALQRTLFTSAEKTSGGAPATALTQLPTDTFLARHEGRRKCCGRAFMPGRLGATTRSALGCPRRTKWPQATLLHNPTL